MGYLGRPGLPATDQKYRAMLAEILAEGSAPSAAPADGITVQAMCDAFTQYAGHRGTRISYAKMAMRALYWLHGQKKTVTIVPKRAKVLLHAMGQDKRFCRSTVNRCMVALRGVFKWAASKELLPPSIWQGLQTVAGLREGQANREPLAREAVPWETVDATAKDLPPTLAVAVKVLCHCGARPTELLTLRVGTTFISTTTSVRQQPGQRNADKPPQQDGVARKNRARRFGAAVAAQFDGHHGIE
jgi:integrase